MFLKQGKDEIPNCKPNLVEIFSRLEKISAQTQGMKKQNHEIFGVFQKSGDEISKIYFFKKKKKNLKNNLERIFISRFWKTPKFHDFIFISPEFERSCFGREFVKIVFFSFPKVCRKKSFFKFHLL